MLSRNCMVRFCFCLLHVSVDHPGSRWRSRTHIHRLAWPVVAICAIRILFACFAASDKLINHPHAKQEKHDKGHPCQNSPQRNQSFESFCNSRGTRDNLLDFLDRRGSGLALLLKALPPRRRGVHKFPLAKRHRERCCCGGRIHRVTVFFFLLYRVFFEFDRKNENVGPSDTTRPS